MRAVMRVDSTPPGRARSLLRRAAGTPASRTALTVAAVTCLAMSAAGCATAAPYAAGSAAGRDEPLQVVAAENFWGSIAAQLGGDRVKVTSIIVNPATDPHDYEPTAADARTIAGAHLMIINGIGYDPWASKLVAANPVSGRLVLNVGELVGIQPGGNPHRWYSPPNVRSVISQITADYSRLNPAGTSYYKQRESSLETVGLATYYSLISKIRSNYAGAPIGASESIVLPLAHGLGLRILTPVSFLDAISEGTEPTAHDKALIDQQIRTRQIKIYVYNSQNATPDVTSQAGEAEAAGIPVVTVTETLTPANVTFQAWQVAQLRRIERALAEGSRR